MAFGYIRLCSGNKGAMAPLCPCQVHRCARVCSVVCLKAEIIPSKPYIPCLFRDRRPFSVLSWELLLGLIRVVYFKTSSRFCPVCVGDWRPCKVSISMSLNIVSGSALDTQQWHDGNSSGRPPSEVRAVPVLSLRPDCRGGNAGVTWHRPSLPPPCPTRWLSTAPLRGRGQLGVERCCLSAFEHLPR